MKRSALLALSVMVSASACSESDGVEVQPLPSLAESDLEARAGVPRIAGAWRFAGWELAENDSASLAREDLPRFGVIDLETQKRDSLAGRYVIQAGQAPLYGEVRRDSVVALVGVFGAGDMRFLTGRLARDTVWMEMSSLTEPGNWPTDARAAFVRTAVAAPFVRLRGYVPPPPPPAVAAADSVPPAPGVGFPPVGGAAVTTPGGAGGRYVAVHRRSPRRRADAHAGAAAGYAATAPAAASSSPGGDAGGGAAGAAARRPELPGGHHGRVLTTFNQGA